MDTDVLKKEPGTLTKAFELGAYIENKIKFFRGKYDNARKNDKRDEYWEKYKYYRSFNDRAYNLIYHLRNPRILGKPRFTFLILTTEEYKKREGERITKGKNKFLNTHTYSMHFFQNSLEADYGSFICNKCGNKFYHSPSTIYKAGKVVYEITCGYCTNRIIKQDHGTEPYN